MKKTIKITFALLFTIIVILTLIFVYLLLLISVQKEHSTLIGVAKVGAILIFAFTYFTWANFALKRGAIAHIFDLVYVEKFSRTVFLLVIVKVECTNYILIGPILLLIGVMVAPRFLEKKILKYTFLCLFLVNLLFIYYFSCYEYSLFLSLIKF